MFEKIKHTQVSRGDFFALFRTRERFLRYLRCIVIGIPVWFVIGILMTFSPEIARALGVDAPVTAGRALMASYSGLVFGDFASGYLSQVLKSRKKVLLLFLGLTTLFVTTYFLMQAPVKESVFYWLCFALGFSVGYWAIFVTVATEQFGTNLRGTVTTTVPNFVRGAVVPLTLSFLFAKSKLGILPGAAVVGAVCLGLAFWAYYYMEETFGRDLGFEEVC